MVQNMFEQTGGVKMEAALKLILERLQNMEEELQNINDNINSKLDSINSKTDTIASQYDSINNDLDSISNGVKGSDYRIRQDIVKINYQLKGHIDSTSYFK